MKNIILILSIMVSIGLHGEEKKEEYSVVKDFCKLMALSGSLDVFGKSLKTAAKLTNASVGLNGRIKMDQDAFALCKRTYVLPETDTIARYIFALAELGKKPMQSLSDLTLRSAFFARQAYKTQQELSYLKRQEKLIQKELNSVGDDNAGRLSSAINDLKEQQHNLHNIAFRRSINRFGTLLFPAMKTTIWVGLPLLGMHFYRKKSLPTNK